MKFSQRMGYTRIREVIQIEGIDEPLKNRLWNNIITDFFEKISDYSIEGRQPPRTTICIYLWTEYLKQLVDELPRYYNGNFDTDEIIKQIKDRFLRGSDWYDQYDFLELLGKLDYHKLEIGFIEKCNSSLKREMAGYRFVKDKIAQITSDEEIVEIEEALLNSDIWTPVNTHLNTALDYISNRETPDYRNSIKEAISAVESLCVIITDDKKASLGQALGRIEKEYKIHGSLKTAFSALYGYTSDSGGIRHKLLEDDIEVSFEDAKFMLVACSAFINYLKSKIDNSL